MPGRDLTGGLVVRLGEHSVPRLDARQTLAGTPLAFGIAHHAGDDDLLKIAERPRMPRVQRPQATERTREIPLVRLAPGESERRTPPRVVGGAEPPPWREDRRKVVRVVVVARVSRVRAGDRIGEPSLTREVAERRLTDL